MDLAPVRSPNDSPGPAAMTARVAAHPPAREPRGFLTLSDIWRRGKRRILGKGQTLFDAGIVARDFYVVEQGVLLTQAADSSIHQPRILSSGDVFILECGGTHFVSCEALTYAVVICLDRTLVERNAETNAAVARAIRSVHSAELHLILKSLNYFQHGHRDCGRTRRTHTCDYRSHAGGAGAADFRN